MKSIQKIMFKFEQNKLKRFLLIIFSFIILIFLQSSVTFAEEHGAPAVAEEGGESKGSGFIKKDEFLELNAAIEQIGAKMKAKRESLKKLLQEKEHITEPKAFRETVKQIEKEYKELKDLDENIEKKRAIIRFRYPDRGFVKQNKKIKVDSLEEIETEATIDKELDSAIDKMRFQYGHLLRTKKEKINNETIEEEKKITVLPAKKKNSDRMPAESLIEDVPTPENDPTGTVILRK